MQLRTLTVLGAIVGLLFSNLAMALGLGEITLKSQFNQPLNAEIRLLKVRDLSKEEIVVSLASREDFRRAGVDRLFFLTGLKFDVVLDNPSNPYIRVTSRKPVTEPYLNFLVEVQWPSGRLLREYTLLLDLPVFNESAPASPAVTAPAQPRRVEALPAQPRPSVQSAPARPAPVSPASSAPAPSSSPASAPGSYQVQRGDTLWEIAEQVRPNRNFSVQQTMIAIQQVNPEAFVGGNINRLRNGRVLRIPSSAEIEEISFNQAVAAVRQQNQNWSSDANQKAPLTASAPSSSAPASSSQPEGRLTLGAADSGQGNVQGSGASGSGGALQNELSLAQEELDRSSRENAELRARVSELEAQIETMEKLVDVTNDQLKALELASSSTDNASPATEPSLGTSDSVEPGLASPEPVAIEPPAIQEPEPVAAPAPPAPAPPPPVPAPAPVEAQSSGGFMDVIMDNLLAIGAIIVGLLLALLAVMRLRNKPEDNELDDFSIDTEADQFTMGDGLDTDVALDEMEPLAEIEEEDSVQAQTEDVVAEAEIYLGLGQENKAIELLQKEIQQNPDNADARLGLLKIYAKSQNAEAFDDQYAQLLPLGNESANQQATALRSEIAGIEPFATDDYSPDTVEADGLQIDDLDDFDNASLDQEIDDALDLDLDLDLSDDGLEAPDEISLTDSDIESDLSELSLELDDLSEDISELDSSSGELSESLDLTEELSLEADDTSLNELIDDFDLDVDDDIAIDLDDGDSLLDQELEVDLESLDVESTVADATEEFSGELDLDIDDDFAKSLEEPSEPDSSADLDIELDIEEPSLDLDVAADSDELSELDSLSLDTDFTPDESSELDLTTDLDDTDDFLASLDDEVESLAQPVSGELPDQEEIESATDVDDGLDLDMPPAEDLDIESLDQEIDAMTAELDDMLPSDLGDEPQEPESQLELTEELVDSDIESLMADESDGDLDFLADSELDQSLEETLGASADDSSVALDEAVAAELDSLDLDVADESSVSFDGSQSALSSNEGVNGAVSAPEESELDVISVSDDITISEDDDLDFIEESDEVATKLDLARAYIDMGDHEGAQDILAEVIEEGTQQQKSEAEELMRQV